MRRSGEMVALCANVEIAECIVRCNLDRGLLSKLMRYSCEVVALAKCVVCCNLV
jgi:hypothetical protein